MGFASRGETAPGIVRDPLLTVALLWFSLMVSLRCNSAVAGRLGGPGDTCEEKHSLRARVQPASDALWAARLWANLLVLQAQTRWRLTRRTAFLSVQSET